MVRQLIAGPRTRPGWLSARVEYACGHAGDVAFDPAQARIEAIRAECVGRECWQCEQRTRLLGGEPITP